MERCKSNILFYGLKGTCSDYLKGLRAKCQKEDGKGCDNIAFDTCIRERHEEFGDRYYSLKYTCNEACDEVHEWNTRRANQNCDVSSFSKKYGITACKSRYQKRLEMSLANRLYTNCRSRCVYDYKSMMANAKGAFLYRRVKKCYKYVKKGGCFKRDYGKAMERAKELCRN